MSCMLTLEEIEIKRQELERHLEDVMLLMRMATKKAMCFRCEYTLG
ncbi:hypothetical protein ACIN5087_1163 [Acinetobacter baumannii OIFC087]|nr:hypothetical protein ACIN5087_1163 [Acinetobacter baumannii OIFC087]